jgi:hypothetical protein
VQESVSQRSGATELYIFLRVQKNVVASGQSISALDFQCRKQADGSRISVSLAIFGINKEQGVDVAQAFDF